MTRLEFKSRVGADGYLTMRLPVGEDDANREVRVTVEPIHRAPDNSSEEWKRLIKATAGSIDDPTFRRADQGEFEKRDQLP